MFKSIFIHDCSSTHFGSIQTHFTIPCIMFRFICFKTLVIWCCLFACIFISMENGKYRQFFISIFERCVNYRVSAKNRHTYYSRTKCENIARITRSAEDKEQQGRVGKRYRSRKREKKRHGEVERGDKRKKGLWNAICEPIDKDFHFWKYERAN